MASDEQDIYQVVSLYKFDPQLPCKSPDSDTKSTKPMFHFLPAEIINTLKYSIRYEQEF